MANKALPQRRQRGVLVVVFALLLAFIVGMIGMAIDLAQLYNRRQELQNVADSAALAAAMQLNGRAAGVTAALKAANAVVQTSVYQYAQPMSSVWQAGAVSVSSAPAASAVAASGVVTDAAAANMLFAKVDTSLLTDAASNPIGQVGLMFMRVLDSSLATATVAGRAVAGRTAIQVTPLAICPINAVATASKGALNELVEFGFRRGVGYNLLNVDGTGTKEYFVVNPVDLPPNPSNAQNLKTAAIAPFMCSGMLPMASVPASLNVARVAPIGQPYIDQLNSRLTTTAGSGCNATTAPLDGNAKPFPPTVTPVWWTTATKPTRQEMLASGPVAVGDWGVLWSYAKAAVYASSRPSSGDYTGIAATQANWNALYSPAPALSAYPSTSPYASTAPPGVAYPRRLLLVPLLACPVGAGANPAATVLGIAKFFMPVPASASAVYGEFAGMVYDQSLGSQVRLIR